MGLRFMDKSDVAETQVLAKISGAIEACNRNLKQQTLDTTRAGSRFLKKLQKEAELTQNYDTVDIEDINMENTLVLMEAAFYRDNLKQDLSLINDLKLAIQLANPRDWYAKFLKGEKNEQVDKN